MTTLLPNKTAALGLIAVLLMCVSCAPLIPHSSTSHCTEESVLDVEHLRTQKAEDCLATCVNMVLKYYGIEAVAPDSSLPLEMISLSHRLNAQSLQDPHGYKLFAAVMELTPEELAAHVSSGRPLIVVFRPRMQKAYHSIVLSGYCPETQKFYTDDPAKRKADWTKISRIPTFQDTGKRLVLLIALHEA